MNHVTGEANDQWADHSCLVLSFSAQPSEAAWYIQIKGVATKTDWSQDEILIIADGKPYYEVSKSSAAFSGGTNRVMLPATMSFKVSEAGEAESIVRALRRRFTLE